MVNFLNQSDLRCEMTLDLQWSYSKALSHSACVHAKSLLSCLTLWGPIDCRSPGSSVFGILQARILEWVAVPHSRGSSQPRDRTVSPRSPSLAGGIFTTSTTWETLLSLYRACECHRESVWNSQTHQIMFRGYIFYKVRWCLLRPGLRQGEERTILDHPQCYVHHVFIWVYSHVYCICKVCNMLPAHWKQ